MNVSDYGWVAVLRCVQAIRDDASRREEIGRETTDPSLAKFFRETAAEMRGVADALERANVGE